MKSSLYVWILFTIIGAKILVLSISLVKYTQKKKTIRKRNLCRTCSSFWFWAFVIVFFGFDHNFERFCNTSVVIELLKTFIYELEMCCLRKDVKKKKKTTSKLHKFGVYFGERIMSDAIKDCWLISNVISFAYHHNNMR